MPQGIVLVTGFARHSLGEAFIQAFSKKRPRTVVVGLDKLENSNLYSIPNFTQLKINLNPLGQIGGLDSFVKTLTKRLSNIIRTKGLKGIECLIQSAGIYDCGDLLEHDLKRRADVLGVNVIGMIEVLHAVLKLNQKCRRNNAKNFTNVLIGSDQGLYAREGRPLYAPSKAFGIDLCTSLVAGREVSKCIYLAAGPIDTHMLHRNHWINKVKGSLDYFNKIQNGPFETYREIFIDCDESAFSNSIKKFSKVNQKMLRLSMEKYKSIRLKARSDRRGVMSADEYAAVLVKLLTGGSLLSGVYGCAPRKNLV